MRPWNDKDRSVWQKLFKRTAKENNLTICQHKNSYSLYCNKECIEKND
jgi:hypothetical protein